MFITIIISVLVAVAVFGFIVALFSNVGEGADQQHQRMDLIRDIDKEEVTDKKEKVKFSLNVKNIIRESSKKREKEKRRKELQNQNRKKKTNGTEDMLMMVQMDMSSEEFAVVKLVVSCIFMILAFFISSRLNLSANKLFLAVVVCGLIGMLLPGMWLSRKVKKYQESILLELPEVMDLLVVSVEAGLGFDAALARLYEKNKSILMEQLMQATRDIQRGVSKKEAYSDLAKRCKVRELTSFLNAMIQADQMGSSIKSVLKTQANTLRISRGRRAMKKAKEAPVKMLIPMSCLIFPVIFIVLLGPAALSIMEAF